MLHILIPASNSSKTELVLFSLQFEAVTIVTQNQQKTQKIKTVNTEIVNQVTKQALPNRTKKQVNYLEYAFKLESKNKF